MELPGARVPPSMRVSPTTPLPPSVPPAFTVASDDEAMEPFTDNVPPLIVVAPVKVLRPSRICVSAPALVSDRSPAGPLISCPENVLLPPEGAMVSVAGAPSEHPITSPPPDSERKSVFCLARQRQPAIYDEIRLWPEERRGRSGQRICASIDDGGCGVGVVARQNDRAAVLDGRIGDTDSPAGRGAVGDVAGQAENAGAGIEDHLNLLARSATALERLKRNLPTSPCNVVLSTVSSIAAEDIVVRHQDDGVLALSVVPPE